MIDLQQVLKRRTVQGARRAFNNLTHSFFWRETERVFSSVFYTRYSSDRYKSKMIKTRAFHYHGTQKWRENVA